MRKLHFLLLALIPLAACTAETSGTESGDAPTDAAETPGVELAAGEYHVECGCTVEGIGACGEYVELEGEMVALELPEGNDLGAMPFCGQQGLVAEIEGDLVDGTFVTTSFAMKE